jgi:PAS domain S-box-containing protein
VINIAEVLILLAARRHRKAPDRQQVLGRTKREMFAVSLIIGIAWGSSVWHLGPTTHFHSYLFVFVVLMGVAGVCLMIFSPDRPSMVAFFAGLLLLPAIHALNSSPKFSIETALGLTVMFLLMIQYGSLANRQLLAEFETNARLESALARLDESRRHLAAIFATTPVALTITGFADGRVVDINQAGVDMMGIERDDIIGKTVSQLGIYAEPSERTALLARLDRDGFVPGIETEYRHPVGAIRTHLLAARVSEINGEKVILSARQDITDRKADESRLRELTQAVEQSPNSVMITDGKGRIQYVNRAFSGITGYTYQEAVGRDASLLRSGKTPPETVRALWQTLGKGESWSGEFINRRKDGSEYLEFLRISPIRETDQSIKRYLSVGEDVTESRRMAAELAAHRHHLEELVEARTEELQAARVQADAANFAKSAFLANMSHEIRTPMNAITGMVHLIRRGGVAPRQAEQLDTIETASRHLLGIIDSILDLSKIEAGKFHLSRVAVDVAGIADNVAAIVGEKARAKKIELRVEQVPLPAGLVGDAARIQQAFLNLATNALKFTERGHVTLRVSSVEESADEALLRFEVEDTGIGVDADVLPRLFASFEQADNTDTRRFGGTGLGLAITRHLAELMGGDAGAESLPGIGSTFWFTARLEKMEGNSPLPRRQVDQSEVERRLQARAPGRRVLVVDDDETNRQVARMLLEGAGFTVDEAEDGRRAVELATAGSYDLILMDMQMPVLDGVGATEELRRHPASREVPIIAITANAFIDDREACLAAGMDDFLTKPFEPQMLFDICLKWLQEIPVEA